MVSSERSLIRLLLATLVCLAGAVAAQSGGGDYRIDTATVAAGGDTSTGGTYRLDATLGQHAAATLASAPYVINDGFWGPASGSAPGDAVFANGFDP